MGEVTHPDPPAPPLGASPAGSHLGPPRPQARKHPQVWTYHRAPCVDPSPPCFSARSSLPSPLAGRMTGPNREARPGRAARAPRTPGLIPRWGAAGRRDTRGQERRQGWGPRAARQEPIRADRGARLAVREGQTPAVREGQTPVGRAARIRAAQEVRARQAAPAALRRQPAAMAPATNRGSSAMGSTSGEPRAQRWSVRTTQARSPAPPIAPTTPRVVSARPTVPGRSAEATGAGPPAAPARRTLPASAGNACAPTRAGQNSVVRTCAARPAARARPAPTATKGNA